jgi:GntR family transcriptional regulator
MNQDFAPVNDTVEPGGDGKADGLPLYLQVASTLRTAIVRGIYQIGSRMPTEEALCRRFDVSRHTIREALRQLRTDGLIASRPGSRPTVTRPALSTQPEVFANEIGKDFFDYTIETRLAIGSMEMAPLGPALALETGLSPDDQWLWVKAYRIHVDEGHATCWNEYVIDAKYAAIQRLLARHVGPLIPLLEDLFGQRVTRMARSMSAIEMPAERAERLSSSPGSPALGVLTRCETADGRLAMLNQSIHPSGVISYTIRR